MITSSRRRRTIQLKPRSHIHTKAVFTVSKDPLLEPETKDLTRSLEVIGCRYKASLIRLQLAIDQINQLEDENYQLRLLSHKLFDDKMRLQRDHVNLRTYIDTLEECSSDSDDNGSSSDSDVGPSENTQIKGMSPNSSEDSDDQTEDGKKSIDVKEDNSINNITAMEQLIDKAWDWVLTEPNRLGTELINFTSIILKLCLLKYFFYYNNSTDQHLVNQLIMTLSKYYLNDSLQFTNQIDGLLVVLLWLAHLTINWDLSVATKLLHLTITRPYLMLFKKAWKLLQRSQIDPRCTLKTIWCLYLCCPNRNGEIHGTLVNLVNDQSLKC